MFQDAEDVGLGKFRLVKSIQVDRHPGRDGSRKLLMHPGLVQDRELHLDRPRLLATKAAEQPRLAGPPAASSAKLDGQPTRSAHGQGRASGGVRQASADSTSRKPARPSTTGWSIGRTYLLLPATRAPERATREGYPAPAQPLAIAATDRSTAGKRKVHIKAARQDISLTATRATPPLECPAADPGRHQSEPETYLSGGYLSAPRWPLSGQPRTAPGMLVVRPKLL